MGQPFAFGFPELDPFIRPLFEEGIRSGQAQDVAEAPMMVHRNDYREEAFFTGNFTPLRGVDGDIEGFYNALFEITAQKIQDRRKSMLNMLTTPDTLSTDAVYSHIISSLATDPLDVSMALLYEADADVQPGKTILRIHGQLGIPAGHQLLCDGKDLEDPDGIIPLCRQATASMVTTKPDARFEDVEWLGFKQTPQIVVTMALRTRNRLFGFLVIGTNPYRPFDAACVQFIDDLSGTASNLLAAALDADNLRKNQEQLQSDLEFSDMKVRHLVEHASVGMAHATPDGGLLWANDKLLSLARRSQGDAITSIYELFSEDDQRKAYEVWTSIFKDDHRVSGEFRLKQSYNPPVGDPVPAQVQLLAFPFREQGTTVSGMVCVTDISHLKWAEAWQTRIAQDARDAKRQQEAFIDVVSHEMRNPLSAIVHCADSILLSLDDVKAKEDTSKIPNSMLDALTASTSAASVILDCCKHQKRIIDDILTLSRLESTLLSVKPSAVRPSQLVDSVIAMFDANLRSKAITTKIIAEPSIDELHIDFLNLDSSRVVQIFINLLTNAIKFMRAEGEKGLKIRYGATLSPPRSTDGAASIPERIYWAPRGKHAADDVNSSAWGSGEIVYLTFSLSDNGIGMRPDEVANIFERFEQANVTTHVNYGGSGLGLFISKELTERMGGEIGVMSEPEVGSTFVFYIKTRRSPTETASVAVSPVPTTNISAAPLALRQLPNGGSPPAPPPHRNLRTLLVEDNIVNQKVLRIHLTRCNIDVEVANHGLEALDILRAGAMFDICLMDVHMPVMDGLTCMREIRALEKAEDLPGRLPIIAVSANVRQEQIESALDAGADRVVQKPYKAKDLIDLMRQMTGGSVGGGDGVMT
jgi:signal transduction histidine kinase/ActR/RegA family two-component response regulator